MSPDKLREKATEAREEAARLDKLLDRPPGKAARADELRDRLKFLRVWLRMHADSLSSWAEGGAS